jgi:hypothetical protein
MRCCCVVERVVVHPCEGGLPWWCWWSPGLALSQPQPHVPPTPLPRIPQLQPHAPLQIPIPLLNTHTRTAICAPWRTKWWWCDRTCIMSVTRGRDKGLLVMRLFHGCNYNGFTLQYRVDSVLISVKLF